MPVDSDENLSWVKLGFLCWDLLAHGYREDKFWWHWTSLPSDHSFDGRRKGAR